MRSWIKDVFTDINENGIQLPFQDPLAMAAYQIRSQINMMSEIKSEQDFYFHCRYNLVPKYESDVPAYTPSQVEKINNRIKKIIVQKNDIENLNANSRSFKYISAS